MVFSRTQVNKIFFNLKLTYSKEVKNNIINSSEPLV